MSTQSEAKTIGDVVRSEGPNNICREIKTVAATTVLDMGSVCKVDSSGNMVPLAGGSIDDVQTFDPASDPSAGNVRFKHTDSEGTVLTTAWIAEDAADSVIEAALNAVLGTSAVSVTGTFATSVVVTFDGTGYTTRYQNLMEIEADADFDGGVITSTHTTEGGLPNAVHTITCTGLAAGTARLGLTDPATGDVHWTDELAFNTSGANWEVEIETLAAVFGDDDIKVTGTDLAAGITLTYSGGVWAGRATPLVQIHLSDDATATAHPVIDEVQGGAETPAGICLEEVASSASTQSALFLVRGPAIVNKSQVNWEGAEPDAAAIALDSVLGITVRDEATEIETQTT
jgi:hypothetical protein